MADLVNLQRGTGGPAWRWKLAQQMFRTRDSSRRDLVDEGFEAAVRFQRLLFRDANAAKLAHECPIVAAAKALWDSPEAREKFKILTLGDCTRELIAERLSVPLHVVEMTERLFFDIRDQRRATDWMHVHVFHAESRAGDPERAARYRAAFWGGPVFAVALVDAEVDVPHDQVKRILDQEILLHMKLQQALEIPLSEPRDALRLLELKFDYDHRQKWLEFGKEKFRHRCEQDVRNHELAKLRLEAAAARADARVKATARHGEGRKEKEQHEAALAETRARLQEGLRAKEQQAATKRAADSPLIQLLWNPKAPWGLPMEHEVAIDVEEHLLEEEREVLELVA